MRSRCQHPNSPASLCALAPLTGYKRACAAYCSSQQRGRELPPPNGSLGKSQAGAPPFPPPPNGATAQDIEVPRISPLITFRNYEQTTGTWPLPQRPGPFSCKRHHEPATPPAPVAPCHPTGRRPQERGAWPTSQPDPLVPSCMPIAVTGSPCLMSGPKKRQTPSTFEALFIEKSL